MRCTVSGQLSSHFASSEIITYLKRPSDVVTRKKPEFVFIIVNL